MKLSDAVGLYVKLRDKKAQMKAEYQDAVAPVQEKMDKLEAKLLEVFNTTGMDSIKTEFGTAYTSTRTTASVADRDVFMDYVKANEEWSLMEVRASSTAIKQFQEASDGDIPPGINLSVERTVNIRRS
jgi:phage host-nuclease inhibitor protein Gam|tara:strand:+ start:113 stop:496 length:384 start_codon:yes stop_codon:yes gene_type:complete